MPVVNSVGNVLTGVTGSGNFVGGTAPTITNPKINTIFGTTAAICNFSQATSAVNTLTIAAANTGQPPRIFPGSGDLDVDLFLGARGNGGFRLATQKTNQQIGIYDTITATYSGLMTFPNIGSSYEIIFQPLTGTVCIDQSSSGSLTTAPPNSSTAGLTIGGAYQNPNGYDINLTVYLEVTAATSADILLGVSSLSTPVQQTIISGLTIAALQIIPIQIYIPAGYFALLSISGTLAGSISGQIQIPV